MNVQSVVRWHSYHPIDFGSTDPICPVCGDSLGHCVTLIIKDDKECEHEIHADCLAKEQ